MSALRPEEVAALVAELAPVLAGARLEKVLDAPQGGFLLRFRTRAGRRTVLVSTRPGVSRLHLVDEPGESPPEPSPAAAELRGLLGGARVSAVDQPGRDRLVRLRFAGSAGRGASDFVLELFGRSGRLLVVDETSRVIRFRAGRAGGETGERYRFPDPPERAGDEVWTIPFEPRSLVPEELRDHETPFHRFLELRMGADEARRDRDERRRALLVRLRREEKRRRQLLEKLEREREEAAGAERWQRYGELLKGELARLRRGQESIEVVDWFAPDSPKIAIPLDPARTPIENVERCFRRARKGKRALGPLAERLREVAGELAEAEERRREVEAVPADSAGDGEAAALARAERWLSTKERPKQAPPRAGRADAAQPARGPRRYRSREGLEILAGRSALENDALTLRTAHGNDLFFHRADRPGPHVILRVPRGRSAAPESIDDAAFLAAHLSGWRGPGDVLVNWTEAKHVRKPKGFPPGKVLVQRAREHRVSPSEGRIATLALPPEPGKGGDPEPEVAGS